MVQGAGTVAGGVVGAGVATSFTYAMGQAWLTVCQRVATGRFGGVAGVLDNAEIREMFVDEFKKRLHVRTKDVKTH